MPRLRINYTITPVPPLGHKPGYYILMWNAARIYGFMTRLNGEWIRRFKSRNGARKAIWREKNAEYHL